jgi:hypothetical protein
MSLSFSSSWLRKCRSQPQTAAWLLPVRPLLLWEVRDVRILVEQKDDARCFGYAGVLVKLRVDLRPVRSRLERKANAFVRGRNPVPLLEIPVDRGLQHLVTLDGFQVVEVDEPASRRTGSPVAAIAGTAGSAATRQSD